MNATEGDAAVHRMPAIVEAARLPAAWMAARSPNADPRSSTGARAATAACSAVSAQAMPIPASTKAGARARTPLGPTANHR